jgi:xanthine/uracil/vitamin C permease (AzgA family)
MQERTANLFDLRRIIGALFTVLGLLLTILGLFASDEEIDRAAGVNINLWAGLGMLVLGVLFLLWAQLRPFSEEIGSEEAGGPPGGDGERAGGGGNAGTEQR